MKSANKNAATTTGMIMGSKIIKIKITIPMTIIALIPRLANIMFTVYPIRNKLPIKEYC